MVVVVVVGVGVHIISNEITPVHRSPSLDVNPLDLKPAPQGFFRRFVTQSDNSTKIRVVSCRCVVGGTGTGKGSRSSFGAEVVFFFEPFFLVL